MNIWVFAVGHSGTTIATHALSKMGWNTGKIDQHHEDVEIRDIDMKYLKNGVFDHKSAVNKLKSLKQPYAVKDPRFVKTQQCWNKVFKETGFPMMLFIVRDAEAILRSHQRRNEAVKLPEIKKLQNLAQKEFDKYTGSKCKIKFEDLASAVSLFNVKRANK
jgi:hypothetical protein